MTGGVTDDLKSRLESKVQEHAYPWLGATLAVGALIGFIAGVTYVKWGKR